MTMKINDQDEQILDQVSEMKNEGSSAGAEFFKQTAEQFAADEKARNPQVPNDTKDQGGGPAYENTGEPSLWNSPVARGVGERHGYPDSNSKISQSKMADNPNTRTDGRVGESTYTNNPGKKPEQAKVRNDWLNKISRSS